MRRVQCRDCLFFEPCPGDKHGAGHCHRYPPVFKGSEVESDYPDQLDDEWCGEWKAGESAEVAPKNLPKMFPT